VAADTGIDANPFSDKELESAGRSLGWHTTCGRRLHSDPGRRR